jgi:hypothetical protein
MVSWVITTLDNMMWVVRRSAVPRARNCESVAGWHTGTTATETQINEQMARHVAQPIALY